MKEVFNVLNFEIKSGEKFQNFIEIEGSSFKMPITIINGNEDGKTVLITGGTHGGEYPGVETTIRLASTIQPKDVKGVLIIIHPVNMPAFLAKTQYINPLDGKNLNRCYPGIANGTVTERIAYLIFNSFIKISDFYMDLHGGDIHEALVPFVIHTSCASEEVNKISKEVSAKLGIKYVVGSYSTNGTFGAAGQIGVPGFLAEIGASGLWCEEEVKSYLAGVKNALKYLQVLVGESEELSDVVYIEKMLGENAGVTGCWYPSVKPGDKVKKGQKLGEIRDFFANTLEEYFSPSDAVVLYVCSSLAINEEDPIYAIG